MKTAIQRKTRYWSCQLASYRKKKNGTHQTTETSPDTAIVLGLLPSPRTTSLMPNFDAKGRDKHTNPNGILDRLGQRCLLPTSGSHRLGTRLILLIQPSLHLFLQCFTQQRHTNRDTRLAPTPPTPLDKLSEIGCTSQGSARV